jgi:hypothetical protein
MFALQAGVASCRCSPPRPCISFDVQVIYFATYPLPSGCWRTKNNVVWLKLLLSRNSMALQGCTSAIAGVECTLFAQTTSFGQCSQESPFRVLSFNATTTSLASPTITDQVKSDLSWQIELKDSFAARAGGDPLISWQYFGSEASEHAFTFSFTDVYIIIKAVG